MTLPGSNGCIYIDTEFQENGWPGKGFEVQRIPAKLAACMQ
jgi:hypothetical protein